MKNFHPYDRLGKHLTEFNYPHISSWNLGVENNFDPDDGNSLLCGACRLPIFSTPFITNADHIIVYVNCANLPDKLEGHVLHPAQPLVRHENHTTTNSCSRCRSICGSMFYKCLDSRCKIQLDVSCALTIKILHRSHEHRLAAVRGASFSFICAVCGTQHGSLRTQARRLWDLKSYMCSFCDIWIHPHCALLPNANVLLQPHYRHKHPLLLKYDLGVSHGPRTVFFQCAICCASLEDFGFYFCGVCHYYVHVKCIIWDPYSRFNLSSDPRSFKPAPLPDLLPLPLADEHTSVMRCIRNTITNGGSGEASSSSGDRTITEHDDDHDQSGKLFADKHEHALIFHDGHDDGGDDHPPRVCNACVRSMSPPFYSCSECIDFFLHSCCAHLPHKLAEHQAHHSEYPLFLFSKVDAPFNLFWCQGCDSRCNGFAYICAKCDFHLDVVCAFMPVSISHDAHGKAHILYAVSSLGEKCHCCDSIFTGSISGICYECNNYRNFGPHAKCALLPDTVSHKFDRHPLKLITTSKLIEVPHPDDKTDYSQDQEQFYEICEYDIDNRCWYYSCDQCDQSFHIGCIPSLDYLSNIKFGFTVRVQCHDCPVTCVRALTIYGYHCDYCQETIGWEPIWVIGAYSGLAFECSKCYFRIHFKCCEKILLEENDEVEIARHSP